MLSAGLIEQNFEAYKEISDRNYHRMKFLKMRDLQDKEFIKDKEGEYL